MDFKVVRIIDNAKCGRSGTRYSLELQAPDGTLVMVDTHTISNRPENVANLKEAAKHKYAAANSVIKLGDTL